MSAFFCTASSRPSLGRRLRRRLGRAVGVCQPHRGTGALVYALGAAKGTKVLGSTTLRPQSAAHRVRRPGSCASCHRSRSGLSLLPVPLTRLGEESYSEDWIVVVGGEVAGDRFVDKAMKASLDCDVGQ